VAGFQDRFVGGLPSTGSGLLVVGVRFRAWLSLGPLEVTGGVVRGTVAGLGANGGWLGRGVWLEGVRSEEAVG